MVNIRRIKISSSNCARRVDATVERAGTLERACPGITTSCFQVTRRKSFSRSTTRVNSLPIACYTCAPACTEAAVAPRGREALYLLVHTPYLRPERDQLRSGQYATYW